MKTHPKPTTRGPFPTDAQPWRDYDPDVPDGVETPVVETPVPAAPTPAETDRRTPLSGSDGPQPGVSAPGRYRSDPAERRRTSGALSCPLQDEADMERLLRAASIIRTRGPLLEGPRWPAFAHWLDFQARAVRATGQPADPLALRYADHIIEENR
jgi:hypothetical protein